MKSTFSKLIISVAAVVILAAAAVFIIYSLQKGELVLKDAESGKVYAKYNLSKDDVFSVSFIHSVNQSEVVDYYRMSDGGKIECFATKFHSFGAGMPTEFPIYAKVETSKDGIYVSNLNIILDDVCYIVGTVSDHILNINGENISLRELCGKNSHVVFEIKRAFTRGGNK